MPCLSRRGCRHPAYGGDVGRKQETADLRKALSDAGVTEDAVQTFNRADVRRAGIPGGGGMTNAATLALFYQALLSGRAPDGATIWKPETLAMARTIRSGELTDMLMHKRANRGLGLVIAGDADRTFRGFGHTNSERAFGHGGAGGQIAWADPASGISLGYCTNGFDRNAIRQARRSVGISSRAAACSLPEPGPSPAAN